MKLLLILLSLLTLSAAQAQLLPTPGTRNPDWALAKTDPPHTYNRVDTLRYHPDPMPNSAEELPAPTDHMPNGARKSISAIGNRRYYWDAARRLRYEWTVKPGSDAPDSTVTVRDDNTDVAYTFRRRPKPVKPRSHFPGPFVSPKK